MLECEVMPIFFAFSKQFVNIFKNGNIFAVFTAYLLGDKRFYKKDALFVPFRWLPIEGTKLFFLKPYIFFIFTAYQLRDKLFSKKVALFMCFRCLPIRGITVQKVHRCNQRIHNSKN